MSSGSEDSDRKIQRRKYSRDLGFPVVEAAHPIRRFGVGPQTYGCLVADEHNREAFVVQLFYF